MTPALLLVLQAAPAAPPIPAAFDVLPVTVNIAALGARADGLGWGRCPREDRTAIVVCGDRGGPGLDMDALRRRYERRPLVAEYGLGGATAAAYVERAVLGRGEVSNRLMVGIRVPF
jgi:hypothetical protein